MKSKVTIIMPAYNCQEVIERAINSVINQTYKNWELIIINDGSTDKTLEVCNKYKNIKKIKIFSKENGGPSAARNFGLDNATGNYVMFLDSDDYYESNMLDTMVNKLLEGNQIVCCNFYQFYNKKKKYFDIKDIKTNSIQKFIEHLQYYKIFNNIWNKIYELKIINENKIKFNEDIEFGEDYEFNIEYIKNIYQGELINEPLYNYYISSNSLTTKYRENEFDIRKHNVDQNKKLYLEKNFDLCWISHLYIEAFVQSIIVLLSKETNLKKVILDKIKLYSKSIEKEITNNYKFLVNTEDKIVGNLIIKEKYNVIYYYIKLRIFIKIIVYKLKGKKNR